MLRKPLAAVYLAAAALVVAAPALAGNGGFAPVAPDSPNAERIGDTYWLIVVFTGFIFVLVEGALIAFVVQYRRRGRPRDEEGPQVRGNTNLEIAWTVAPVLILAAIGAFVFYKLPGIQDVPKASASGAERLVIKVEGRQFYWNYTYPNGVIAVDRMRVPVNTVVRLELTAPEHDVVHSWWIPDLGGKMDTIPGQTNETWFEIDEPGLYRGQCAEFCGLQHASMLAAVEALPEDEFERWLAEQETPEGEAALGRATYRGACAKCHGFEREGLIGPPLTPAATSNRVALEQLLHNGGIRMPAVGKGWDDRQLDALIAHLQPGDESGG